MSNNFKIEEVGKKAHSAALALSEISDTVISETLVLFSSFIEKTVAKSESLEVVIYVIKK